VLKKSPAQNNNVPQFLQGTLVQVISDKCQCFTVEHQTYISGEVRFCSATEITTTKLNNSIASQPTTLMIPHHFSTFVPKNTFGFILEAKTIKELYEHSIEVGSCNKKMIPVDTVSIRHYLKIYFQNDVNGWVSIGDLFLI